MSEYFRAGTKKNQKGRGKAKKTLQLEDLIFDILREDHPQTVRYLYYRLTDSRLPIYVPKTEDGYRKVCYHLVAMRKEGTLPYEWIVDTTRAGWHVDTYRNTADFIRDAQGSYRGDLWARTDYRVEVWVESRSIAGLVHPVCNELAVSLYPCGGNPSITLTYDAARDLNHYFHEYGKKPIILYIGDYDPAGETISADVHQKLRGHLDDDVPLQFIRLGVTPEQIREYGLPGKPRKEKERRAKHILETVEAETLSRDFWQRLVREHVECYLPLGELEAIQKTEKAERLYLLQFAEYLDRRDQPGGTWGQETAT